MGNAQALPVLARPKKKDIFTLHTGLILIFGHVPHIYSGVVLIYVMTRTSGDVRLGATVGRLGKCKLKDP